MAERVWLVRHAETEWSLAQRHTGRTDVPLSAAGREHASALAAELGETAFSRVLCSPLSRARQTAELAGLSPIDVHDELMEWDYGEYEGLTTQEIRARRPGWSLWHDGCPGGENVHAVGDRVDRVIADVLPGDGDVAIVAHGHVLRVLGARWIEQPPQLGERLQLRTGMVSLLGFEREVRVIGSWNS